MSVEGCEVLTDKMAALRDIWEETSFRLERLQANPSCVEEERQGLAQRLAPPYHLTFDPNTHPIDEGMRSRTRRIGVIFLVVIQGLPSVWVQLYENKNSSYARRCCIC